MAKKKAQTPSNVIAQNRKARHDYDIAETFEAGIVLLGTEVKALRQGHGNLSDSYGVFSRGELFLMNSYIGHYSHGTDNNHDETRSRKLLMHKREIEKLQKQKDQQGMTLVPLKMYWHQGKVKVELALVRGKKQHDKRASIKERDWNRQQQRLLKR